MKLTLALLSASLMGASAFTATTPSSMAFTRSLVSLNGSRASDKALSRKKWAEERGYGTEAVAEESDAPAAGLMSNDEGLEFVRLVNPDTGASSEVYLFGGVVTSYKADGVEYIAVRPDAKMDGSKPISGGLSHCWPQVRFYYFYYYYSMTVQVISPIQLNNPKLFMLHIVRTR